MARLIPVIDLMRGEVVRAVAGRRDQYQPIRSSLCQSSSPREISRIFRERFHVGECYVAELDSLRATGPKFPAVDWRSLSEIGSQELHLILDIGLRSLEHAAWAQQQIQERLISATLVLALESFSDPDELRRVIKLSQFESAIFSLDLYAGCPRTCGDSWQTQSLFDIVEFVWQAGFRRLLVLDVAAVGVGEGPTTADLCSEIRRRFPKLELFSGGGIRNPNDIRTLALAGCDGVLVASALHDGRLTVENFAIGKKLQSNL